MLPYLQKAPYESNDPDADLRCGYGRDEPSSLAKPTLRVATILNMDANIPLERSSRTGAGTCPWSYHSRHLGQYREETRCRPERKNWRRWRRLKSSRTVLREDKERAGLARPKLFNVVLTVAVTPLPHFPSGSLYFSFMVGCNDRSRRQLRGAKM